MIYHILFLFRGRSSVDNRSGYTRLSHTVSAGAGLHQRYYTQITIHLPSGLTGASRPTQKHNQVTHYLLRQAPGGGPSGRERCEKARKDDVGKMCQSSEDHVKTAIGECLL